MSIPYLQDYLDVLDSLPNQLSRQYSALKQVEIGSMSSKTRVKELIQDFLKNLNNKNQNKSAQLVQIAQELKKIKKIGYEQVEISSQTCVLVNEHLSRLESDLLKFEEDQLSGIKESPKKRRFESPLVSKELLMVKSIDASMDKADFQAGFNVDRTRDVKRRTRATRSNTFTKEEENILSPLVSPLMQDKEPTYCICSQVSFGEMIACDNEDCSIEWFHYKCVGLDGPVKGKWYCPDCQKNTFIL